MFPGKSTGKPHHNPSLDPGREVPRRLRKTVTCPPPSLVRRAGRTLQTRWETSHVTGQQCGDAWRKEQSTRSLWWRERSGTNLQSPGLRPSPPLPALPCPALPSPALPCPALPSPALPCLPPLVLSLCPQHAPPLGPAPNGPPSQTQQLTGLHFSHPLHSLRILQWVLWASDKI